MKKGFKILVILIFVFLASIVVYAQEKPKLSREDATKMLIESLKDNKMVDLTRYYSKQDSIYTLMPENNDLEKYRTLEEKGFVMLKPIRDSGEKEKTYGIVFTEKAEPYIIKKEDDSKDKALISIGKAEKIDITELKPVSSKEYKAEFLIGYRLTPFGEILLGKQTIFERKEDAFFEQRDGGWKIRFKTTF
ncbi:MAG TPA: hypothetical protein PK800_01705 [Syntrophorhabdaceae bacterium]|nr:hypothetical protein [Syntrophorhabdaceae bacterium]